MTQEGRDVDLLFNKNTYYRSIKFKNRKAKVKVFMHFNDLIDALTVTNYKKIIKQIKKIRFYLYGYAGSFYNDNLIWGKDLISKYELDYDKLENKEYPFVEVEDTSVDTLIKNYNKIQPIDNNDNSEAKKFFKSLKNPKVSKESILQNYSLYNLEGNAFNYIKTDNLYGINVDSLERLAKLAKTCVNNPKEKLVEHWVNLDVDGKEQFLIGKCSDIPVEFLTIYDTKDYSNIFIFTINNENYFIGFNTKSEE